MLASIKPSWVLNVALGMLIVGGFVGTTVWSGWLLEVR